MSGQALITIGESQWQAYLAVEPWELAQGLGELYSIDPNTGMLFDTGWEQLIQVTTIPMHFPIDICFLSESLIVTEVYHNIEPGYLVTSTLPARFFLEVNAGELEDIEVGEQASAELLPFEEVPVAVPDWVSMMVSFMGFMVMAVFMIGMVKSITTGMLASPGHSSPKSHYLSGKRPKANPGPTREDVAVETWFERDRSHVRIDDKRTGETLIEWWDEDVEQLFEDGFFKRGRGFENSVLTYAEHLGVLAVPEGGSGHHSSEGKRRGEPKVYFIGGCKVRSGLCFTHGYSVSKAVRCPESPLNDEEWAAAWELAEVAFPEGMGNPWVNGWWPKTLEEVEKAVKAYEWKMGRAVDKFRESQRKAIANYEAAARKAPEHYRGYLMREYYKGRGTLEAQATSSMSA